MKMSKEVYRRWARWLWAILVVSMGKERGAVSWFRRGSVAEDEMVTEANGVILDTLADADTVNQVELATGRNLREQISVEEAVALDRERKLRGWGVGRN